MSNKDFSRNLSELFKISDLGRIEVIKTESTSPVSFVKVFREGFEHNKTYAVFESDFAEGGDTAESNIKKVSGLKVKRFIEPQEVDENSDGLAAVDDVYYVYLAELGD